MPLQERIISTPYADISLMESGGSGLPLILLHGNSNSRHVFRKQLESELAERYRLIAIDLPGHGRSGNAFDPQSTYSIPGYAVAIEAVIQFLDLEHFAIVGWSLGGHVAMELVPRRRGISGIMIIGAPPVGNDLAAIQQGFHETPALYLAGKEDLSTDEIHSFIALTLAEFADEETVKAIRRSHGLARRLSFEALLAGKVADERQIVETFSTPIAVVNGERDPIVNLDYVGSIKYQTLWNKHCFILRDLRHAPFLEAPEMFNPILARFMADLEIREVRHPTGKITRGAA